MVRDMLLPDYADSANREIVQLRNDLLKLLSQKLALQLNIGTKQITCYF